MKTILFRRRTTGVRITKDINPLIMKAHRKPSLVIDAFVTCEKTIVPAPEPDDAH